MKTLTASLLVLSWLAPYASALDEGILPAVLLVTDESLADAWQPFADHKTRLGLPTQIVTMQSITLAYEGEDVQSRLRSCVLDYIENQGTQYIILGGDSGPNGSGLVPDRDTMHRARRYRDIPTDLYYLSPGTFDWDANNDGVYGDWQTDMDAVRYNHPSGAAIGRIPVRTAEDVAAYTDKIIAYELNYPEQDFAQNILYTNTVDGSEPKVRRSWDDYLSEAWPQGEAHRFFHTETAWDGEQPGSYALNTRHWLDQLNGQVASKMHMHGHGMPGFWVLEDDGGHTLVNADIVEQLTNQDAYVVMTTVSCFTGMYDAPQDPTIVETMLRSPGRGAIVVIAPSREGVPIFHNPQVDFRLMVTEGKLDGTTESMTRFWMNALSPQEDGGYLTIGQAFMQMKAQMAEHAVQTAGYHWCQSELNLLGDPTLDARANDPVRPGVRMLDGRGQYIVEQHEQVSLVFTPDAAIPSGSRACIWMPGEVYQVVLPDEDGRFIFDPFTPDTAGMISVSISGPSLNAYLGTIWVVSATD